MYRYKKIQYIIGLAILLVSVGCTHEKQDYSSWFADLEKGRNTIRLDEDWKFLLY